MVTTLKINAVTILARTNDTTFTNGTIMLGHMDSFGSIGSITNSTIYDNVRVISLTKVRPVITAVRRPGATVEVDFTAGAADLPSAFTLESSITLPGGFATDSDYSIISLGGTSFRATSSNASNTQRFFRIKR